MLTKLQKLERIQRYATAYELAAVKGEERILIAYTVRRSRHGLLSACRNRAIAILAALGSDEISFPGKASAGAMIGSWRVIFTGRTQREAIIEGEFPYVGAYAELARKAGVDA